MHETAFCAIAPDKPLPSLASSTEPEPNFEESKSVECEGWKKGLGDHLDQG